MSAPWLVVLGVGAGTLLLKGLAPATLGGRELPPRLTAVMAPVLVVVLAAAVTAGGLRAIT